MKSTVVIGLFSFLFNSSAFCQSTSSNGVLFTTQPNPILTVVPFLNIAPDARSNGMGMTGVATSVDANSMHWNTSKLAFANHQSEVWIQLFAAVKRFS